MDPADLGRPRETVHALLASVAIGLDWRECRVGDASELAKGSAPVAVILMPFANPSHRGLSGQVTQDHRTRSPVITVYVPAVADRARAIRVGHAGRSDPRLATVSTGHLVGLTIAHELGHALHLPHSASGLMQEVLDLDDVRAMRDARLGFTASEGARMRRQLLAGPKP